MADYKKRGIEQKHEQDQRQLIRDTRTLFQRFTDFFANPTSVVILLVSCAVSGFFIPQFVDILFLAGVLSFLAAYFRKTTLPFRLPASAHMLDYNDPASGSKKPRMSRGISFFGNDIETNEELWFTNEDMRTHVLIFGSTGSGKTEALVSLAYNSLVQGSGFIYIDGKGDNSLFAKIFSMCRAMGREDDVLLVNFMTGARDIVGPQLTRLSNTMNPFASGSSSMLSQLAVSMMDASSASADGDMWKGRAIVFVEALMKVLVYMRDKGHLLLDANTIRNYFILERLEAMAMDKQFIRDNQEPVDLSDAPTTVLEPIINYVINLPGYDKSRKGKQVSQVLEQHGFITMQLTRVFGSFADTYGHIMRTNLAEVDFKDIVLNRRILVVLLPALEKSPDELANLGKIIIASLKAMMAAGLGDTVEGEFRDLIKRKPTNAASPFVSIMDEYGYYAVKGFAVVPAQARSLGFSAIFAGQDLPAFQKASKEEAASIGANCNIKICMKLEDPTETWEFFTKSAGEAYVTKVDAFQTRPDSIFNTYMDTRSSSAEKRSRIDLLDLKEQREGEAHILFKSKIIRAKMFYANPTPVAYMRLNQLLKVAPPNEEILIEMEKRRELFRVVAQKQNFYAKGVAPSEEINAIVEDLAVSDAEDPIERGISALLAHFNRAHGTRIPEVETTDDDLTKLNMFTKLRVLESDRKFILTDDMERFSHPLLSKNKSHEFVVSLERSAGKADKYALSIADEVIKDIENATVYPPNIRDEMMPSQVADTINDLLKSIIKERENAGKPAS
ncbi:MAG TPA: TraM recognition domain-containing protein [Gammaproteobacteria bacterium]|nr:TraM recognition domain-containing protein [Gammaproteobacteria bacterium]